MSSIQVQKIREENPADAVDWDERLRVYPHANAFHTSEWAQVLRDTYGYRPRYLTIGGPDEESAMLPLMEVSSPITGIRGISLPFTDECEPLGNSREALDATLSRAVSLGRASGWRYLETRGGSGFGSGQPEATPSMTFYSHHLPLSSDLNAMHERFEGSVRRAIRKAETSGMQVTFSHDADAVEDYYRLHCRTRRVHGLPPQPVRFFRNIHKHLLSKRLGTVVSARHNGQTIASALFLRTGREAIYKFGASDPAFLNLRANNLVMWHAIQWCASAGVKVLNFGRTSLSNEGLRRFKLGWGSQESRLNYYKFDLRKNQFVKDTDATEGWHTALFRLLPPFASRWAGAALYRHVA